MTSLYESLGVPKTASQAGGGDGAAASTEDEVVEEADYEVVDDEAKTT